MTTTEQQHFIQEVILPVLIELACNDKLPLDMTELSPGHFDKKIEDFNAQYKNQALITDAHAQLVSAYESMQAQDYSLQDWESHLGTIEEMEEKYDFLDKSGLEPEED